MATTTHRCLRAIAVVRTPQATAPVTLAFGRWSCVDVAPGNLSRRTGGSLMSRPIHVEESGTVARSAEAVWSAVADYATDVEWRKGLTDMTPDPPGPPAVGTK